MGFLKDNRGYSLLEMIITIGLIGIAIGTSSFGLSVIFNSNVNARASELVNEIRITQTKQMASSVDPIKYRDVVITHDGANYVIKTIVDGDVSNPVKTINMPKTLKIQKMDGLGSYKELVSIDDSLMADVKDKEKTFRFDPSSGRVLSSAYGNYKVTATNSSIEVKFVVVALNGRVYIDE